MSVSWIPAKGRVDSYTVQLDRNGTLVPCNKSLSNTTVNNTCLNLNPGVLYCVVVVTKSGPLESNSSDVCNATFPNPPGPITVVSQTVESINFTWTFPDGMDNNSYNFSVSGIKGSYLTTNNWFLLDNLESGSPYNISVVTVGVMDYKSTAVTAHNYTRPYGITGLKAETINTTTVNLFWLKPLEYKSEYTYQVNTTGCGFQSKTITSESTQISELNPGTNCTFCVSVRAADGTEGEQNCTFAYTRPDVVSNITAIGSTTTMSVSWIPAKGRVDSYTVQLDRNGTLVPCNKSLSNTTVNNTCLNLNPGVLYCVVVVTKSGPLESNSSDVCNATFPNPPGPITVVSQTVESINFTWTFPDGMDNNSYNFSVSGIKGSYLTTNNWFLLDNLEPGSPYNISVVTVGVMDYKSTAVTAHNYTNASSVKHLTCEGPNTTNAQIILSWTKPSGQYSAFRITVNNDKINNTEKSCCNHTVSGLVHYTEYTLSVTTESWGQPSAPVTHQCRTGITNPPIPPNYESLVEVTNTVYNRFSLQIDSSLLNNTNGPITDVGVLVTDSILDNTSDLKVYLGKTYKEWKAKATPVYLATVRNATNLKRSVNVYLSIDVGDESTLENYDNGALEATGRYRYAIVLFTRLSLQNKLVNGQTSLVSITKFYPAVPLPLNPVVLAVAVVMGIFIIFVIFLIGFIIYWRRVSNKQPSDIQFQSMRAKVSVAVRVEDFEAYYKKQKSDSSCGFAEEFEELKPVGTSQSKTNGLNLENKPKNRYNNVLPYDSSRVKLSVIHGSPYDDYINANYMPGHNSRKEFIAAQGPLPATVDEFWRMIWEKNVQTMVMLTRCHEQGRIKCEQYWGSGTKYFENITVTTISEIPLEDWTIRDFNIKNVKTAETRTVRHFHFTAWPDHGVPQTTELLISFRHLVREHMDQYSRNSPTVVHCSAGVGRTGTFIAIDRLIFQIERENIVDVFGIVHDLRMHRPLMVQTEDQYVFLNQCAMDIIRSRTGNNVDLIYQNAAAFSIYENVEPQRKHGYNNA
uniref:receptor-type tyrosine-protein phosphatase eta n=1 Tax=Monopterus albus TaxID=43700 RepID=UPI0009B491C5|nr:receptor-type tyrosine-protein phosphatase eta [Monopterus albus]